jgi:hypothetical protein
MFMGEESVSLLTLDQIEPHACAWGPMFTCFLAWSWNASLVECKSRKWKPFTVDLERRFRRSFAAANNFAADLPLEEFASASYTILDGCAPPATGAVKNGHLPPGLLVWVTVENEPIWPARVVGLNPVHYDTLLSACAEYRKPALAALADMTIFIVDQAPFWVPFYRKRSLTVAKERLWDGWTDVVWDLWDIATEIIVDVARHGSIDRLDYWMVIPSQIEVPQSKSNVVAPRPRPNAGGPSHRPRRAAGKPSIEGDCDTDLASIRSSPPSPSSLGLKSDVEVKAVNNTTLPGGRPPCTPPVVGLYGSSTLTLTPKPPARKTSARKVSATKPRVGRTALPPVKTQLTKRTASRTTPAAQRKAAVATPVVKPKTRTRGAPKAKGKTGMPSSFDGPGQCKFVTPDGRGVDWQVGDILVDAGEVDAVQDARRCAPPEETEVMQPATLKRSRVLRGMSDDEATAAPGELPSSSDGTRRVTIWNSEERRKISGTSAPLRRNLSSYLSRNPDCEEYVAQDDDLGTPSSMVASPSNAPPVQGQKKRGRPRKVADVPMAGGDAEVLGSSQASRQPEQKQRGRPRRAVASPTTIGDTQVATATKVPQAERFGGATTTVTESTPAQNVGNFQGVDDIYDQWY